MLSFIIEHHKLCGHGLAAREDDNPLTAVISLSIKRNVKNRTSVLL